MTDDSFEIDGDGEIIRQTESGTEDYSSPAAAIVSPGSGSGTGAGQGGTPPRGGAEPPATTPIRQGSASHQLNSNATALSRTTTDIQGNRVKETTSVSTMPDGTTIRTTETSPLDPKNKSAVRTTVHERTEASGQMTRTTLTNHPDGSRVKQVETIRPGGSKSVMIETTDANGQRNVETAEYPPTLVSPPEHYGMGSGQTVVSEITFARTQAPWASPESANYSNSRPIDVDDMKELEGGGYYDNGDNNNKQQQQPYWTTNRKLVMVGATILLAGVAAGAAVGIVMAGNNAEKKNVSNANDSTDGNSVDDADDGNVSADEDENDSNPFDDLINSSLTPASVGFENEWRSEDGWVVAPSFAETGKPYYRPYLISDLGLCADRCTKTDSVGGAFFPRTNGEGSLCYCFLAAECLEPLMSFPPGGTIFMSEPMPKEECNVSICWYYPDDPLCEGVEVIFDQPTPSPSVLAADEETLPPTLSPTVDEEETDDETDDESPPDADEEVDDPPDDPTNDPTPSTTTSPTTVAPSPQPSPVPTEAKVTESPTALPTASPTVAPTAAPTTAAPADEPTIAPAACSFQPLNRDIPCGDFRYIPWAELKPTAQVLVELKLEYDEETWNNPGTSLVETLSWNQLSQDQKLGAQSVGFTQQTWDCYQNHYRGYSWDTLAAEGVQEYYRALGFEELSWYGIGEKDLRDVSGLVWNELSSEQRSSLEGLCYSETLWNGSLSL